jgi:hypothetical protein
MQIQKRTLLVIVSVLLGCTALGPASEAQPRRARAPQAVLKLVRVEPAGQEVLLVFRVPEALELNCPIQLRIGDLSVQFREIQDANARTARFVVSRELYKAIDSRRHQTVLTSCQGWVANTITYPRLVDVSAPPPYPGVSTRPTPQAGLTLVRVDPEGQDVLLVFRVPEALELNCPMQLRIGDLSIQFREVQDANARIARFVVSRELYKAIDSRRHQTVLTSCYGWVTATITYPRLADVSARPAPQAGLTLMRVDPEGQDVLLVFRVPEALDLNCPMQLRIGDLSIQFREVQDVNARVARFVVSRELYKAIDSRQHQTVLTSCYGWVNATITYPPLSRMRS